MSTPPTFGSGQILTSQTMNSVGLWLVKTQVVGSAVSTVTVTGVFSSDYDNYKIIWTGGTTSGSGGTLIRLQLGSIATNYFSSGMQQQATSATVVTTNASGAVNWILGYGGNAYNRWEIDIAAPNLATSKTANTKYACYDTSNSYGGTAAHWLITSTPTTAFTLTPAAGTFTGGTIYVYGYKGTV